MKTLSLFASVGSICLSLHVFVLQRLYHGAMQFNDVSAGADGESQPYYLPRVEEEVEISDSMAVISVPPPRFRPGDPAYILHDFNRVREENTLTHTVPKMLRRSG